MLTWYYDTARTSDLLDIFRNFDDVGIKHSKKSKYEIDENGIKVELPGVSASNLDVNVEGKVLKISGKSRHNQEFSYSYTLSSNVDTDAITASLKDGLLEIKLPKKAESAIKKVYIST